MPSDSYTLTISDIGFPASHAASHGVGAADAVSISTTQITAGTLGVARGGTGAVTLTGYVKGTGTTLMTAAATVPVGDISGTLLVANGGTGVTTSTGSGSNVLSTDAVLFTPTLGTPKAGSVLTNCTGLPLTSGAGVTGILPVAYGGTGTVGTSIDTLSFDKLKFKTASQSSDALNAGELRWNSADNTLDLKLSTDVTLQVGQESNIFVKNEGVVTIPNGSIVYISGADVATPAVQLATNANFTAERTLGMATQQILAGAYGYITTQGLVRDLNTSAYVTGTPLYLNTGGLLTSTKPVFPAIAIRIGIVVRSNSTAGSIYVQPQLFSDGRTSGQFAWDGNDTIGPSITVMGMTSASNVIIQQRNTTSILHRSFGAVCSTDGFVPHSDSGTSLDGKLFSYIAFV